MRIWDIETDFLNDQSLLGEHRELHGIHSIISNCKTGYSRHPETLRWISHLSALVIRHELLVEEMKLRGFNHCSPLDRDASSPEWPLFIDQPAAQYRLLQGNLQLLMAKYQFMKIKIIWKALNNNETQTLLERGKSLK